jgi:CO/xanthine dehydrogenase Mo-binding subunit
VPQLASRREVEFIDEPDLPFNPLGVKGVGEVGMVGVAPLPGGGACVTGE